MLKEERDVSEEDVRPVSERDMTNFRTLDSSEIMNAILGDRWWPQKGETGRG